MRKIKQILLFCAVFLSILLLTGDKDRIQADDDDSNFTNLVVFARFAGETEFINDVYEGSSVRKITDNYRLEKFIKDENVFSKFI